LTLLSFRALEPEGRAATILTHVRDCFRPFEGYLRRAHEAAKARSDLNALPWSPFKPDKIRLEPLDSLFRLKTESGWIRLLNWPRGVQGDPGQGVMVVDEGRIVPVTAFESQHGGARLRVLEQLPPGRRLFWCGRELQWEPDSDELPDTLSDERGRALHVRARRRVGEDEWRVVVEGNDVKCICDPSGVRLPATRLAPHAELSQLSQENGTSVTVLRLAGGLCEIDDAPTSDRLRGDNGVLFTWQAADSRDRPGRAGTWVQLEYPETPDADQFMFLDPRAVFCEADVDEVYVDDEAEGSKIRVLGVDRDEYRLRLERLPPRGSKLRQPAYLRNLDHQRRAIAQLLRVPLRHHRGLLRLAERADKAWRFVEQRPTSVSEWHILRDPSIDGTAQQREFVMKALRTAEFAFLGGPPGSGKTTAICELVLQLAERGERVLLTSTTNCAVDNVLETLLRDHSSHIDAVRIGREERVDHAVQKSQIDQKVGTLVGAWSERGLWADMNAEARRLMAERIVVNAANLTCGTTTGLLSHPAFRPLGKFWSFPLATSAPFDTLIIDEASKTTVQEFLVPALLARRWIVVGDVRQLPPFTERLQLAASLRDMAAFPAAKQRACLLKARLGRAALAGRPNVRWLIVEPAAVLDHLWGLLESGHGENGPAPVVRVVDRPARGPRPGMWEVPLQAIVEGTREALLVHAAHWLLVEPEHMVRIDRLLPPAVMRYAPGADVAAESRRSFVRKRQNFGKPLPFERGRRIRSYAELEEQESKWLRDRDWAGEVVWRETRRHELRFSGRDAEVGRLEGDLDELVPEEARSLVAEVAAIGLPSVLETVERGVGGSHRASTLTTGMPPEEFDRRNVPLTYQHRMHPEISDFPRQQFYGGQQLEDAGTVKRRTEWSYSSRWPSRRTWIDVHGRDDRGVNRDEIRAMEQVLDGFRDWVTREGGTWSVACLTFYVRQERAVREMLKRLTGQGRRETRFELPGIEIVCGTVDRFQGREADLVLLSFRNTERIGFLDSVNRLNVAVTRARRQLLLFGNAAYFANCDVEELKTLVDRSKVVPGDQP